MNEAAPSSFQSLKQPQIHNNKRIESYMYTIVCWLMTIAIWVFIILIIYISYPEPKITKDNFYKIFQNAPLKKRRKIIYIIAFSIIYIIYFILEFCSPLCKYLYHIKKLELYEEMRIFFGKKPSFNLKFKCTEDDSNKPKFKFRYNSFRDISGLFELNINKDNKDIKKYILLELNQEIKFADINSFLDYNKNKENFLELYKDIGLSEVKEIIKIKSLEHNYMIKLDKEGSFLVNFFIFIILTILSFGEIYKLYIYYISVYQQFTIRKIVSTKKDLKNDTEYNIFNPQIKLFDKYLTFDSKIYNYLLNENNKRNSNNNNNVNKNLESNNINTNDCNSQDRTKIDDFDFDKDNMNNHNSKKVKLSCDKCESNEICNTFKSSQKDNIKKSSKIYVN